MKSSEQLSRAANINYAYLQMTTFGTEKFEWVAESAQTEDAKTRTKQSCP